MVLDRRRTIIRRRNAHVDPAPRNPVQDCAFPKDYPRSAFLYNSCEGDQGAYLQLQRSRLELVRKERVDELLYEGLWGTSGV